MKTLKSISKSKLSLSGYKILAISLLLSGHEIILRAQHSHDSSEDPNVVLHVNPELGMCDFDIASNFTQSEWGQLTREAGNALYLNPMAAANTLGRKNWSLFIDYNSFHVDQESGAWNNSFHHPDSVHWLTGTSERIAVPSVRFQMGLNNKWDAGIMYTSAIPFGANYGFLGFESKYAFLNDTIGGWSAAARLCYTMDANIKDFNIGSAGLDILASKKLWNVITPYVGVTGIWNHGRELTTEVDLRNEHTFDIRGIAGVNFQWRFVTLGYEFMLGTDKAANRSLKFGVVF